MFCVRRVEKRGASATQNVSAPRDESPVSRPIMEHLSGPENDLPLQLLCKPPRQRLSHFEHRKTAASTNNGPFLTLIDWQANRSAAQARKMFPLRETKVPSLGREWKTWARRRTTYRGSRVAHICHPVLSFAFRLSNNSAHSTTVLISNVCPIHPVSAAEASSSSPIVIFSGQG